MDLIFSKEEKEYLSDGLDEVKFNEPRISDIENTKTFSYKEPGGADIADKVKRIRGFCKKFGLGIVGLSENNAGYVLVQVSKKRRPIMRWLVIILFAILIIGTILASLYRYPMFWVISASVIAVIFIFLLTKGSANYFRDSKLNQEEESSHIKFLNLSDDRKIEILNSINDQQFTTYNNRFTILTTIAAIAAASLVIASFQSDWKPALKIFILILMLMISIAVYTYAIKMEQLIRRAERFFMNIYSTKTLIYKSQYNPLRSEYAPESFIERFFQVVDKLPIILSITVAVIIIDIVLILWINPTFL